MRTTHDDRNSGRANGVGDAIRLGDPSSHGANADQSNAFVSNVLCDLKLVHRLSIAVDQQHFMAGRSQGFEQEHPEVRHEVASHAVVGVVEQNFH